MKAECGAPYFLETHFAISFLSKSCIMSWTFGDFGRSSLRNWLLILLELLETTRGILIALESRYITGFFRVCPGTLFSGEAQN